MLKLSYHIDINKDIRRPFMAHKYKENNVNEENSRSAGEDHWASWWAIAGLYIPEIQ